jgi:hypothetical protein
MHSELADNRTHFTNNFKQPALRLLLSCACLFGLSQSVQAQGYVDGQQIFPSNSIFNTKIDNLPTDQEHTNAWLGRLFDGGHLRPDFGTNPYVYGIPWNNIRPNHPINYVQLDYPQESDTLSAPNMNSSTQSSNGYFPVDSNLDLIEGGTWDHGNHNDRHILNVCPAAHRLFELYWADCWDDGYHGFAGAIWDLNSNQMRRDGDTSADAAGLPVFPLLVRYDEAASGHINHCLRFTINATVNDEWWPASHYSGLSQQHEDIYPPMGIRIRLKRSFDISGFSPINQTILRCMQEYGMLLADNGDNLGVPGDVDPRWDDQDVIHLSYVAASNFEVVDDRVLQVAPNSFEASQTGGNGGIGIVPVDPVPIGGIHRISPVPVGGIHGIPPVPVGGIHRINPVPIGGGIRKVHPRPVGGIQEVPPVPVGGGGIGQVKPHPVGGIHEVPPVPVGGGGIGQVKPHPVGGIHEVSPVPVGGTDKVGPKPASVWKWPLGQ